MPASHFTLEDDDHMTLHIYHWHPEQQHQPRGIVHIAHGMAETALRYERFAEALTQAGYLVYANDHRGHGQTAYSTGHLGYPGVDGFNWMVHDLAHIHKYIRRTHPTLPLYLLGHSMGSFLTQKYMYTYPQLVDGIILSGTNGPRTMLSMGRTLAKLQQRLRGERYPSLLLNSLSFGSFNRSFRPNRTGFDWLSRDTEEVDKFIADPMCGFIASAAFFDQFFDLLQQIHRPGHMRRIPKELPVYIFAGERDPVGHFGKGVLRLVKLYEQLGLTQVSYKLYPEGRHEMLNEINRDEVSADLIAWLNEQCIRHSASQSSS